MSVKNIAASVRQRLLNRAKSDGRPFNELLQYYAMERFLYRLSKSAHRGRFVLKGALILRVWQFPESRPTMDIDVLGITSNEEAAITEQMHEIVGTTVEDDGLVFDMDSLQTERITEDADYHGIRVRFKCFLDAARITMQIDVGFGDIVYPGPSTSTLPVMLDMPAAELLCYSKESVIAEKFEAMVKLGSLNSRMKDFYDIWLLSRMLDFDGAALCEAVRQTFTQRKTAMPEAIIAFSDGFAQDKQVQWRAFRNRLPHEQIPESFAEIVGAVRALLAPVAEAVANKQTIPVHWAAPGPWISSHPTQT